MSLKRWPNVIIRGIERHDWTGQRLLTSNLGRSSPRLYFSRTHLLIREERLR